MPSSNPLAMPPETRSLCSPACDWFARRASRRARHWYRPDRDHATRAVCTCARFATTALTGASLAPRSRGSCLVLAYRDRRRVCHRVDCHGRCSSVRRARSRRARVLRCRSLSAAPTLHIATSRFGHPARSRIRPTSRSRSRRGMTVGNPAECEKSTPVAASFRSQVRGRGSGGRIPLSSQARYSRRRGLCFDGDARLSLISTTSPDSTSEVSSVHECTTTTIGTSMGQSECVAS
jgi:hypothetical protein